MFGVVGVGGVCEIWVLVGNGVANGVWRRGCLECGIGVGNRSGGGWLCLGF